MTRLLEGETRHPPTLPASPTRCARQAELDYHDCIARFGHASAEAHVAQMVWRRLRSQLGAGAGSL